MCADWCLESDVVTKLGLQGSSAAGLAVLELAISNPADPEPPLGKRTDYSYELHTAAGNGSAAASARITAATVYGVGYGLETFSQLVGFGGGGGGRGGGHGRLPCSEIAVSDAPRFPHRGLMIDTGRRYGTFRSPTLGVPF